MNKTVYVLGLGHIGLPIAAWIALSGYQVVGIDIDRNKLNDIRHNRVKIHEHFNGMHLSQLVYELVGNQQIIISDHLSRLDKKPAIFIITVGINPIENGEHDLSSLQSSLDMLIPLLKEGDLVIFKTTMIPGTCEDYIAPQLIGRNIMLAYCPETIAETRAFIELNANPRILAALDEKSWQAAAGFYRSLSPAPIIAASSFRIAELAKVVQNVIRDVNVALANELAELAELLNVDNQELRELVNVHPRVELLQSGPGVGGYCLPNALGYLQASIKETDTFKLELSELARKINQTRPGKVVQVLRQALAENGKQMENATVAILGLGMKDYCADTRLSPALAIINLLTDNGVRIKAYDPLIECCEYQVQSLPYCLDGADAVIICALQEGMKASLQEMAYYLSPPLIIIDTRDSVETWEGILLYRV
ncbi:MAG: nucleotide sugar dehydrogenase [Syntrophomonadaceae bacterium]|nr:nucleotide sugar dehydrogenase [Syntrophomonadaceae bacterium]